MLRYIRNILILFSISLFLSCQNDIDENTAIPEKQPETTVQPVNAQEPIILTNPVSARAVVPAKCTFIVGAYTKDTGSLTYQWYSITEEKTTGEVISGANSNTYEASSNTTGKIGFYCIITNTIEDNGDKGRKTASVTTQTAWLETITLSEVIDTPVFIHQPHAICVQKDESAEFVCTAEVSNYNCVYRWFETDEKGNYKTPIGKYWSSSPNLKVEPFEHIGIRYFVCAACSYVPAGDDIPEKVIFSNLTAAAYTELPIIKINTINKEEPTAETISAELGGGNYGATIKNATKVPARMQILKSDEKTPFYDSGDYVKKESGLTLKLRGNTSSYGEKKPYKIKLQKKADLLAELLGRNNSKYEDKEWILLKDATSLNTFVGMTVADIAGTEWTPEFAFVNVIINDDYRGTYLLIEAISRGDKRINVKKDGYIIERDAYWWNENIKFITGLNQKYTFKYPDEDDITQEQIEFIKDYMNIVESKIQTGEYEEFIDTESFARWQLIHDILGTGDAGGSNIYETKLDSTTPDNTTESGTWSKIIMSTPWDFDSNYSTKDYWSNVHYMNRIYSQILFSSTNTSFKESYKLQWENIKSSLLINLETKLEELKNNHGEDINLSRKCDAARWNTSYNTVEQDISIAQDWFNSRANWINSAINSL